MKNALTGLVGWFDERIALTETWNYHMARYYAPKNFNFWYFFGVLSLLVLVNQLLTGIWLTMFYTPSADEAFASVEYIMRDVEYGWILRYMHSTGASAFFAVVYLHMFRGLLYGSYKKPRELVWLFGMCIYLALMAEGFLGYVLPWGQMSYWGAQVIVSLFGAIPVIGDGIVEWVRGDYLISGVTLNRFFALHVVVVPIVLLALVLLHVIALHEVGSNNPDGVEIKKNKDANGVPLDGVAFHPYYTVHDLVGIGVFLIVFCSILFFMPEMGGYFLEYANFEEANPLKTPEHIAPVWYYTPFYAMLRAVTSPFLGLDAKFWGFMVMAGAIAILFVLPWLDRNPIKSIRYRGNVNRMMIILWAAMFIVLGVLGAKAATVERTILAQIGTLFYMVFFVTMPFWSNKDVSGGILRRLVFTVVAVAFALMALQGGALGAWFSDAPAVTGTPVRVFGLLLAAFFLYLPSLIAKDVYSEVPERVTSTTKQHRFHFMAGVVAVAILCFVPLKAAGASAGVHLYEFEPALEDKAALQRGAKTFVNYCLGCHEAGYSRYERVATDLGIPADLVLDNLVFDDSKIGSLMTNAMPEDLAKKWFGATPPDLTLVSRARGADWLYTYLQTFYEDDARPWGTNNLVFKDVGMPNVLLSLQGEQKCVPPYAVAKNGGIAQDPLTGEYLEDDHTPCGRVVHVENTGSQSPEEFEATVHDLVSFMAYMAEPAALKRQRIGVYALLLVLLFLVFAWLLNREYWKDIGH